MEDDASLRYLISGACSEIDVWDYYKSAISYMVMATAMYTKEAKWKNAALLCRGLSFVRQKGGLLLRVRRRRVRLCSTVCAHTWYTNTRYKNVRGVLHMAGQGLHGAAVLCKGRVRKKRSPLRLRVCACVLPAFMHRKRALFPPPRLVTWLLLRNI